MRRYKIIKTGDHECKFYFNYRDLRVKYAMVMAGKDKVAAHKAWRLAHTLERWAHMRIKQNFESKKAQ